MPWPSFSPKVRLRESGDEHVATRSPSPARPISVSGSAPSFMASRAVSASPNALTDATLESITAVGVGGTSLFGGRGLVVGSLLGAVIVGVFRSGLSLAGVDDQYRVLAIGVLVITAVAVDQWIRKVRA